MKLKLPKLQKTVAPHVLPRNCQGSKSAKKIKSRRSVARRLISAHHLDKSHNRLHQPAEEGEDWNDDVGNLDTSSCEGKGRVSLTDLSGAEAKARKVGNAP